MNEKKDNRNKKWKLGLKLFTVLHFPVEMLNILDLRIIAALGGKGLKETGFIGNSQAYRLLAEEVHLFSPHLHPLTWSLLSCVILEVCWRGMTGTAFLNPGWCKKRLSLL